MLRQQARRQGDAEQVIVFFKNNPLLVAAERGGTLCFYGIGQLSDLVGFAIQQVDIAVADVGFQGTQPVVHALPGG